MKKFFGLLLLVILGFTACEGPMGPEGPPGRDGKDGAETKWDVKTYKVKASDWDLILIKEGNTVIASYYECIVQTPQLTEDFYYDGAIICYLLYVDDGYDVQTPLPYTFYNVDNAGSPYSIEYSFNVQPTVGNSPGTIAFRLTPNDMIAEEVAPPALCEFRLTLIY